MWPREPPVGLFPGNKLPSLSLTGPPPLGPLLHLVKSYPAVSQCRNPPQQSLCPHLPRNVGSIYLECVCVRMDWLDLLAAQGTLKSLLQYCSSKESVFQHSAFFTVQLTSIHDHWKNHSLDQMDLCWQTNVSEISPRCSLEGLMLKLKLQYFGHLV